MEMSPRLAAYSAVAFSFFVSNNASSQTVYHDFDPDLVIDSISWPLDEIISMDVDWDGQIDLSIFHETTYCPWTYYMPGHSSTFLADHGALSWVGVGEALLLSEGSPINASLNWVNGLPRDTVCLDTTYLAWRLPRAIDTLYGWMRVEYNKTGLLDFKVFDLAYQVGDPTGFNTGDTTGAIMLTPTIVPPSLEPIWVVNPGSCSTYPAEIRCQATILHSGWVDELRIFAIPVADTAGFTLADAQALSPTQYYHRLPPSTYSPSVSCNIFYSIYGDLEPDITYVVGVLIKGDASYGVSDSLFFSDEIVPTSGEIFESGVENLSTNNLSIPGLSPDKNLQIRFETTTEECVDRYEVFVAQTPSIFVPDLPTVLSMYITRKETVTPDNSGVYTLDFTWNHDVNGQLLKYDTPYTLYVATINELENRLFIEYTPFKLKRPPKRYEEDNALSTLKVGHSSEVQIYDLMGRPVFIGRLEDFESSTSFPTGIYVVAFKDENEKPLLIIK